MSFTRPTIAALDAARRALGQHRFKFELLDHNKQRRGYKTIAVVTRGWLITEPPKGGPLELFIAEQATGATEANLSLVKAVAVAGRVYKISGDQKQTPMGTGLRLFSWHVKPTTETHSQATFIVAGDDYLMAGNDYLIV